MSSFLSGIARSWGTGKYGTRACYFLQLLVAHESADRRALVSTTLTLSSRMPEGKMIVELSVPCPNRHADRTYDALAPHDHHDGAGGDFGMIVNFKYEPR